MKIELKDIEQTRQFLDQTHAKLNLGENLTLQECKNLWNYFYWVIEGRHTKGPNSNVVMELGLFEDVENPPKTTDKQLIMDELIEQGEKEIAQKLESDQYQLWIKNYGCDGVGACVGYCDENYRLIEIYNVSDYVITEHEVYSDDELEADFPEYRVY